jgi:hypothetical protein
MGELLGRLMTGAIWGAGAGAVMVFGRQGVPGLRTAAKTVMTGYVVVSEKLGEARDTLDDLYTEARGEAPAAAPARGQRVPVERESPDGASEPPRARSQGGRANGSAKPARARSRA